MEFSDLLHSAMDITALALAISLCIWYTLGQGPRHIELERAPSPRRPRPDVCDYCHRIFAWPRPEDIYQSFLVFFCGPTPTEQNRSVSDVMESARRGCTVCALITRKLKNSSVPDNEPVTFTTRLPMAGYSPWSSAPLIYKLIFGYSSFNSGWQMTAIFNNNTTIDIMVLPVEVIGEALNDYTRRWWELPSTNGTEISGDLARRWHFKCKETHHTCRLRSPSTKSDWLPTRLLSISSSENDGNDIIRIVDGSSLPTGSEYVALSHCWGQTKPLHLSASTFAELRKGILVTRLPNTFRDAVTASKWLNYSLIWIDCLCIMQDSLQDWEAESHMMKHVYSNAALTIAAAHAGDSHQGLFVERDTYSIHSPEISITYRNFKGEEKGSERWGLMDLMLNTDDVDRSPLAKRAWAIQERALSARLLIFGESQMFYRCHVSDLSETFPVRPPRYLRPSEWEYLPRRGLGTSPWTTWHSIVAAYSRSYLTREEDKIIALAGIAGLMQDRLRNPYVVGLWGKNLEMELLWSVKQPRPRPTPCIAPTWSWLSTNGEVSVMTIRDPGAVVQLLVEISKVNVNLVDPTSPTGNIHPGSSLTLQGSLNPARWSPKIYDGAPFGAPWITFDGLHADDNAANSGFSLDFDEPMSLSITREHIFLLPVAVLREANGSGNTVQGLLLVCENCSTPTYRRVARWILPVESAACLFSYGRWGPIKASTITIA